MITRSMNVRITFYELKGGQSEDGDVVTPERSDVLTCWAEVKKTTVKEFQKQSSAMNSTDGLTKNKDSKTFLIRSLQKKPLDSSMFIDFKGKQYKIVNFEEDYAKQDMTMVSGVSIT